MTFTRYLTFQNIVIGVGVVLLLFGIFFLCGATLTPAFTDMKAAEALAMISRENFEALGSRDIRYEIWETQMMPYRTNRFLLWDIGVMLVLSSGFCLGFQLTFQSKSSPQVLEWKWALIIIGMLGYGLIFYEIVYSFTSEATRYLAPLFYDAHIRGFIPAFIFLMYFWVVIPIIGLPLLWKRGYQGNLFIAPKLQSVWIELLFAPFLIFFIFGFVVSVIVGPAAYSAAGFAIWIWIILCTRAYWLGHSPH
ncbi:MAG: hypothetical protein AB8B88_11015 [Devosiaceae bacterium]